MFVPKTFELGRRHRSTTACIIYARMSLSSKLKSTSSTVTETTMNAIKKWWDSFYVDSTFEMFNGLEFGIRHISGKSLDEMVDENHHFGVLLSFACFTLCVVFVKTNV